MRILFRKSLALSGLVSLALLAGCAATESKLAVPYVVELSAANDVNSGGPHQPSPIKVTVYELKTTNAFGLSDFFSLQKDAQAALGDQLLNVNSVILTPGKTERITAHGNVDAKVLGIVAAYRDLDNSQWRLTVDLPAAKSTNIYKFWQFSPSAAVIKVDVNRNALQIRPPEQK
ncbi:hypothetical protein AAEX37_00099 [Oligella sp. MSHR50489EDL]